MPKTQQRSAGGARLVAIRRPVAPPATPVVALTVPAQAEFVGIVRLCATAVATSAGADVDDVDDIRIAVAELCHCLLGHTLHGGAEATAGEIRFCFSWAPDHLDMTAELIAGGRRGPLRVSELTGLILEAVTDHLVVESTPTRAGLFARRCWERAR